MMGRTLHCVPDRRRHVNTDILRIGCAAGFSGDRLDAAGPVVRALVASGGPAFLIFETLAERTLALAQLARRADPEARYEPLLADLLRPVLADCLAHGVRIVSNFGAANPASAARRIHALARALGLPAPPLALAGGGGGMVGRLGGATPAGAARRIHALARELGLPAPRIAIVEGDDVSGPAHR